MIHRNSEIRSSAIRRVAVGASVLVLLVLMTVSATGTVAADAPDCSTVSYNGDGTEANPYEVGNVDQLQCIEEQDLEANYVQISNIDASETQTWNSGAGFDPVGEGFTEEFSGSYNGNGYVVTDLFINRPGETDVGLFGTLESTKKITELGLERVSIVGNIDVGGIAGTSLGITISDSYVEGTIRAEGEEPRSVGGIVGNHQSGVIKRSYSSGSIEGDDSVGGLVGIQFGSDITESYSTSVVEGDFQVGGLVGSSISGGDIEYSYARGDVSGDESVGGLVGESLSSSRVIYSYATGRVEGNTDVGGLIGLGTDGLGSYWDIPATGQEESDGSNEVGLGDITDPPPADEMTGNDARTNMERFDFTETWDTVPGDYPILAWQAEDEPAPPNFEVSIDSTNSPVTEGETLTVTGTIENTGDEPDTQTITATVSGVGSTTETVNLNGGESRTETINVPTSTGDAGTYALTVESGDDTATETVAIESEGDTEGSPVEDVSDDLWTAVTQDDGDDGLSLADLGNAIQQYQASPGDADVDGVNIDLSDLGALIQYYRNEVA